MFSLWKDRAGSVAIYTAVVGTMMIGSAVLAIDYGRLTVLRTQLQNAADAAAQAGAAQLDAQPNAQARAIDVATNAAQQTSGFTGTLTVQNVEVLRNLPNVTAGITDQNARFVRVTMAPENVNLLFQPVLNVLTGAGSNTSATLSATATAQSNPILCPPATVLACSTWVDGQLGAFLGLNYSSPEIAGYQLALRQSDTAPIQRAVFHMLCPPGAATCTEAEASQFSATGGTGQCGTNSVKIVDGPQSAGAIADGINARFGDGATTDPAANVIYYGRDQNIANASAATIASGTFGLGDYDTPDGVAYDNNPDQYWSDRHGGAALPVDLLNATRYQVHLYESGETFARNGNQTIFPVTPDLPPGFAIITPPGEDIPVATGAEDPLDEAVDGQPDPPGVPSTDPKRRVVTAAIAPCEGQNFAQPITINSRFIELFITERSQGSTIFGEIVGPVVPQRSPNFHTNVQLVE